MFKLWNFGVLGGEAQGNASIRKFSYLLTDEDTETISDVKADNFFISEKARLLLNDVIEVLDTKDTNKVYHFLRVKEVSLTSVKTEELGFDANAINWGEISGTITSQEDLIKYIKDREIDNSKSKLEVASHKLNIQLVNEMGTIKYDKNIDVLDTIEQDNHNLIDSHSVWKELIDKINSEFKAEIDTNKLKLKLKLINNNGDLILNKEYEFDIDLTPTENSKNLIDSNGVWEKDVNKDNSYFKLDKTDWKVKLKLVLNDGTEILNEEIDYLQMATYDEIYKREDVEKYINPLEFDLAVLLWNTDTTYATGKLCYKNGKIYKSKIDNNKGNDPELDTTETNWAEYSGSIEYWKSTKTYKQYEIVKEYDATGNTLKLFYSKNDGNLNNDPLLDTTETNWGLISGKGGIEEWSNTKSYKEKDLVYVYDDTKKEMKIYYSVIDANTGNDPTTDDGTKWKPTTLLNEWWDATITYPKNYIVKINNTITYNEYDATITYAKNNIIYVNDGGTNKYYISLIDGNVGNDPLTDDGTHWKSIGNPGNDVMLLYKSLEDGNINNNPITSPDKWVQVLNSQINNMVPSGKYIDLTYGASEYTAPANGWFAMSIKVKVSGGWLYLWSSNKIISNSISFHTEIDLYIYLPVAKGEKVLASFATDRAIINYLRFVYSTNQ